MLGPAYKGSQRGAISGVGLALVVALVCCRERPPEPQTQPVGPDAPFRFSLDDPLTFVYADLGARFRHAEGVAGVPEAARQVVRVIEPTAKVGEAGDDDPVHVVDMTQPSPDRELETEVMTGATFRRRAIAALPPGLASRVQLAAGAAAPGQYAAHDQVIVYTTRWCGACKQLRDFLRDRQVDFIERDVERDVDAAREVVGKAAAVGMLADRVPIIDVRGMLLVGFEPVRLTTLLGDQI